MVLVLVLVLVDMRAAEVHDHPVVVVARLPLALLLLLLLGCLLSTRVRGAPLAFLLHSEAQRTEADHILLPDTVEILNDVCGALFLPCLFLFSSFGLFYPTFYSTLALSSVSAAHIGTPPICKLLKFTCKLLT